MDKFSWPIVPDDNLSDDEAVRLKKSIVAAIQSHIPEASLTNIKDYADRITYVQDIAYPKIFQVWIDYKTQNEKLALVWDKAKRRHQ